jgi:hypothetical protein
MWNLDFKKRHESRRGTIWEEGHQWDGDRGHKRG